ncbi:MAG: DUF4112 domain-containing protein [Gemmatimonadales bacterium]
MRSPGPSRPPTPAPLEPLRAVTRVFDEALRIPGTPLRLGLDALLGLVPGVGDAVSGCVAAYGLWVGARLGAPAPGLLRLLFNVAVDAGVGAIPLAGDLFDIGWKANRRNLDLLERWVAAPAATRAASVTSLAAVGVAVLAMLAGLVWLAAWGVGAVIAFVR